MKFWTRLWHQLFRFTCCLCWVPGAWAQVDGDLKSTVQLGMDAWHIEHSATEPIKRSVLYMADSNNRWNYREASPWYTVQSQFNFNPDTHLVLYARANQGSGADVDQFYVDHALSPSLGIRTGVADYRATWCREYDLDNPWVREGDPFCSDRVIKQTTSSAPALQIYAHGTSGPYQWQGIVGLFRPRLFGYARREFGGWILRDSDQITKNHKYGVSLSAINTFTSTEWRFSWVGLDQRLFDPVFNQINHPDIYPATQLNYHQQANTFFAGVSWQIEPRLRSRVTHMRSALQAHCEFLNPAAGPPCSNKFVKNSTVFELSYQLQATDVVSLALLKYPVEQVGGYERGHYNAAMAWRRDWGRGWFSALQLTRSQTAVYYNNDITRNQIPFIPGSSSAWGLGMRLGYQL